MECIYCKGEMQRGTAPFHLHRKGCHVTLEAVPAWVCTQCGEAYFEEAEVAAIQEMLRTLDEQARHPAAPA